MGRVLSRVTMLVVVSLELNNGSLECEVKKMTGLGSDLMTAVTPTSPGAYTVR